ncbi:hypothetical protein [Streptomyces hyaluromycini]|uniref:hypothetical protein n=1 Tax=Streptomyces hyaluromycini TaxID=1377993 RepID=UPI0011AE277E|nr:hypothetical protein [Streptomyces hyaluromycini]
MRLLRGAALSVSALLVIALVLTGLFTRSAWSDIRHHSAPQITSATGLYFTLNAMDAQLANQLMFGTDKDLADDRSTAAQAIADFGSYEEGASHALILSKQHAYAAGKTDADTLAAYRSTTDLMRTRLLDRRHGGLHPYQPPGRPLHRAGRTRPGYPGGPGSA